MSHHFRLPPFVTAFFQPIRQHPVMLVSAVTAAVCAYLEIRASRVNYTLMCATQNSIAVTSASTASELRETLKTTDQKFLSAMRLRDDFIRRLELQNVEQVKSLTQLNSALRLCVRDPKEIPEFVKSAVVAAEEAEQQQQQAVQQLWMLNNNNNSNNNMMSSSYNQAAAVSAAAQRADAEAGATAVPNSAAAEGEGWGVLPQPLRGESSDGSLVV